MSKYTLSQSDNEITVFWEIPIFNQFIQFINLFILNQRGP